LNLHLDFFAAAMPSLLGTARGKVTLLFLHLTKEFFGLIGLIMDSQQDENAAIVNSRLSETESVSFSDAARFLGVDVFTFYSMVQREEIPSFLGAWGEFVVSQEDLDKLVAERNALC
jgi:hypothetical protein